MSRVRRRSARSDLAPLVDDDRDDHDDRPAERTPDGSAQVVLADVPLDEPRDALDERLLVGVRRLATVDRLDDALVDVDARDVVPARMRTGRPAAGRCARPMTAILTPHGPSGGPAMACPVSADSTILRASSSATIASCGSTGGGPPSRTARANSRSSTASGSSR